MTMEEKLELGRKAMAGEIPFWEGGVTPAPGEAPPMPGAGEIGAVAPGALPLRSDAQGSDELFSAADLGTAIYTPARFRMPNGKYVWVHPASVEEVCWIANAAERWVRNSTPLDAERRAQFAPMLFQVIACCRKSEAPNSPRVFGAEDADALWRLGWDTIRRICAASDAAAGDETTLERALLAFFGATERCCAMWSSQLSTGSTNTCREGLARFASCVSRIRQRGAVDPADLSEMLALIEE